MKIGMSIPSTVSGCDRDTLCEWIRRIDAGPFSRLATGERIASPFLDLMGVLSAAAVLTERVPIQALILREVKVDKDGEIIREVNLDDPMNLTLPVADEETETVEMEGAFVVRDGRALFVPIKIGIAGERHFEVLEGAEDGDQNFDILILDAFSGDSVPVHLLTREAFEVYKASLKPDGLIVMHVSNQHLELMPQVARQGADSGYSSLMLTNQNSKMHRSTASQWVFLVPESGSLDDLSDRIKEHWRSLGLNPSGLQLETREPSDFEESSIAVWTDDYSDLASIVIFERSGSRSGRDQPAWDRPW